MAKLKITRDKLLELTAISKMDRHIPDIWTFKNSLYIGANGNKFFFKDKLSLPELTVLALDQDAYNNVKSFGVSSAAVCDLTSLLKLERTYEMTIWPFGPGMLKRTMVMPVLASVLRRTTKLCVVLSYWGLRHYSEAELMVEKYPAITAMYVSDFKRFGFETITVGHRDTDGSFIIAWKKMI